MFDRYRIAALLALLSVTQTHSGATQIAHLNGIMTPMRDGIKLASDVWLPSDRGRFPLILVRTPYVRTNGTFPLEDMALFFAKHGYGVVLQDVRGRGDSEGEFNFFFQEGADGFDTIEWLAQQPWSNGRVGMMGVSYLGTTQWLAARERPPHLVCIAPTAPAGRYLDELPSVGGAFGLEWAINWLYATSLNGMQGNLAGLDWESVFAHRPLLTMDSVAYGRPVRLYREFLQHQTQDDYWQRILFTDADFAKLDIPALTTTGWFDGDQLGALTYWRGMRARSPAKDKQYLLAGPWTHPQTFFGGALKEGGFEFTPDSRVDMNEIRLEWFDYCLKNVTRAPSWPRARIYFTGRNVWRSFDEYPPREAVERSLYLHSGGKANSSKGDGKLIWVPPGQQPADRYTYDPKVPVPSAAGSDTARANGDQRSVESREDVLVYTSEALEEAVDAVGEISVELFAATDARDTDFMVKLIDVQPDGRALKVGVNPVGVLRARYRQGLEREVLLTPGQPETYKIGIGDIAHTFMPGHRIRLEVLSSYAPFFNPNQNTGNPIATDTQWRVARQTVFHDRLHASRIVMPVIPAPALRP